MPSLGLCVIAKDAASTLRPCLESARGVVDAVVVVDTGSTDETPFIAQANGARVVAFPWKNDFSAARNRALTEIKTDWVLVLDADEELDQAAEAWIRRELQAPKAEGYVTSVRNYIKPHEESSMDRLPVPLHERHPRAPDATSYIHSEVCRLYRRDAEVYYVGHIHEQVEYRLMQLGRPIGHAGFFIHHFGWYLIEAAAWEKKRDLYAALLEEKLRARPDDPQVLLQYGDALASWYGREREGLDCFLRVAALNPTQRGVWMHIGSTLLKLNQPEAALIALERLSTVGEEAGRRAQLQGEAFGALGRWEEARQAFTEASRHYPESQKLRLKLAMLEMKTGDATAGRTRLQAEIAAAEAALERHPQPEGYLRAAEMLAQIGQWSDVLRVTRAGLAQNSSLPALEDLRMRAAVATEDLAEAAEAAGRLAKLQPQPRNVLRHAAILKQAGHVETAQHVLRRGCDQFADSTMLAQASRELDALVFVPDPAFT